MRWDDLFADLEFQATELKRLELEGEVDERIRAQVGRIRLIDRVRAAEGDEVSLRCTGGLSLTGRLTRVGSEWLLLDEPGGREAVVAAVSVLSVSGLGRLSATEESMSVTEGRLGLRYVLRGVARDRSAVRIHLSDGQILDGTIDRVGADFIEVAEHAPGESRRRGDVRRATAVANSAIVAVRRDS